MITTLLSTILFGGASGLLAERYAYAAKRLYVLASFAILLYVITDSASQDSLALLSYVAIEPCVIWIGTDDLFQLWNSQIYSLGILAYIASQFFALPISFVYSTLRYVRGIILFNMATLPIGYYLLFSPPLISVAITSAIFLLGTFASRAFTTRVLIAIPSIASILSLGEGMQGIRLFIIRIFSLGIIYFAMRWSQ